MNNLNIKYKHSYLFFVLEKHDISCQELLTSITLDAYLSTTPMLDHKCKTRTRYKN